MTRWEPGREWETDAVRYRVTEGRKHPDDLVLWVSTTRSIRVPMSLGFVCADFFHENETRLFAARAHLGGSMYAQALHVAMEAGWQEARSTLEDQKNGALGRDAFGLREWGGPVPWLVCDQCGKGRAELKRNLAAWIPKCNLTDGCAGVLREKGYLPPMGSKR